MIRTPLGRGWWFLLGGAAAGALLMDLLRPRDTPQFIWDHPAFFTLMGAVGTILLVVLAKVLVSAVADRRETYYEELGARTAGGGGDDASLEGAAGKGGGEG